jgi:hypothetical protein
MQNVVSDRSAIQQRIEVVAGAGDARDPCLRRLRYRANGSARRDRMAAAAAGYVEMLPVLLESVRRRRERCEENRDIDIAGDVEKTQMEAGPLDLSSKPEHGLIAEGAGIDAAGKDIPVRSEQPKGSGISFDPLAKTVHYGFQQQIPGCEAVARPPVAGRRSAVIVGAAERHDSRWHPDGLLLDKIITLGPGQLVVFAVRDGSPGKQIMHERNGFPV